MTIVISTLLALVISFVSFLYLRNTDPKRRRVHHQPAWQQKRYQKIIWVVSILPGAVLIFLETYAAFIMWFAAFSLIGWLVAIPKPKRIKQN